MRRWHACLVLLMALAWSAPAAASCRYDVVPDAGQGFRDLTLDVAIRCDRAAAADAFAVGYGAEAFVTWRTDGVLGYRIALGALAAGRSGADFAQTARAVMAPVNAWLAAPVDPGLAEDLRVTVAARPELLFLANFAAATGEYVLNRQDWGYGGYTVFTDRPPLAATAPGPAAFAKPGRDGPRAAAIRIAVLDDGFALADVDIVAWIERFAGDVARFWAGFPSDRLLIALAPGGRPGNPFGRVRGGGGATMTLRLAKSESLPFLLRRDWVLTHELIHLGAPFARSRQPWFMEGMATYLEPLIRVLGGAQPERALWAEWLRAMPTGADAIAAQGLEGRGHPYWTGAAFFLEAHMAYLDAGRPDGLAVCFRGMRRALGDAAARATVAQLIGACDNAVGLPTLAGLQRRYSTPRRIDLQAHWRELGIAARDGQVTFAPEGSARRALTFDNSLFSGSLP